MTRKFKAVLLLKILVGVQAAFAQPQDTLRNYFKFPVYPGKPNTLSGVLGDLRSNHFHGGIDIRTAQREGLPVTAAADGYVSRIAVQRGGYGKVIYIRHPNSLVTVYGHLQRFGDKLARYVRDEQYKNQTFEIDLTPEPGQFPVKKGELIALSGNTGSSQGPHLHFEIRDSHQNHLNPLAFDFPEIRDQTPPRFVSIALVPMDLNARIEGTFDRKVYKSFVKKGVKGLALRDTIRAAGVIGLELEAFDRMDGTGFNYGVSCIEVRLDGKEIFAYNMKQLPATIARDYNYLVNYEARQREGARYYKCYNPKGNQQQFSITDEYRGKLIIRDTLLHQVSIRIFDTYENVQELQFVMKGEAPLQPVAGLAETGPSALHVRAQQHLLKVTAPNYHSAQPQAVFYRKGQPFIRPLSYYRQQDGVFLWDQRDGIPDSVRVGNLLLPLHIKAAVAAGQETEFMEADIRVKFSPVSLFDTLYLEVRRRGDTLQVQDRFQPLKGGVDVVYRPVSTPVIQGKTHIYRLINNHRSFVGGYWDEGRFRFTTRELGEFYPLTDTIPPKVRLAEHSPNRIRAYISDELSGIQHFRAWVNGEWVLMNYEYKQHYLWSEKRAEAVPFEGDVILEVTDRAGNTTTVQAPVKAPARKK